MPEHHFDPPHPAVTAQRIGRYTLTPHPDPRYGTWYVQRSAPAPELEPVIEASCPAYGQARRIAGALAALDEAQDHVLFALDVSAQYTRADHPLRAIVKRFAQAVAFATSSRP